MAQSSPAAAPLADIPLTGEELERAGLIDFSASHDSELSVGTQLVWKLKAMIARGALRDGDRLPSVRELAGFANVNVNTARAAYLALEEVGMIASEHGRGTYVTERGGDRHALDDLVRETLARAREGGIDRTELAAAIWAAGAAESRGRLPESPLAPLDPEVGAATLRRELRAQISRIETEVAAYAWHDPRRPPPDRVETAIPVGRVTSVAELQATRDDLIERLSRLRGEAERRGAREQAGRTHVEGMVSDPATHKWEIVTSDQTGDPDCKNWRVVPRWGPLGAIMGWWRVKVSSGCPLAGPLAAASRFS
jgi:DNA-binding transcriptional regulator YhcF (GntR family)